MNPIEARKRIVHLYQQTQNDCETARRCHTFPQRVRKWVQRDQQDGEQGLHELPKTPKRQPRKTDPDTEQRVLQLHQKTHSGRRRLARHLAQDDEAFYLPCVLSLDTVESFLGAGLGWLYDDHDARGHSGYGMEGRTPYACCVALGFGGASYVGLMPVVL
jgi:transposase-like protein